MRLDHHGDRPGARPLVVVGGRRRRAQSARHHRGGQGVPRDERRLDLRGRRRRVRPTQPDRRDRGRPARGGVDPPADRR